MRKVNTITKDIQESELRKQYDKELQRLKAEVNLLIRKIDQNIGEQKSIDIRKK
jgi:hypothetical protein